MNRSRLTYATPLFFAVIITAVLASLSLGVTPAYASVVPQAIPEFTITGGGWGHGIGLSQYGAKGLAEHGMAGEDIATYYYPETSIDTAADKTINVNLDNAANYRKDSSTYNKGFTRASWRIRPGYEGGQIQVGSVILGDTTNAWTVQVVDKGAGLQLVVTDGETTYGPWDTMVMKPVGGSPGLIQIVDSSGPFNHGYVRYRGELVFTVSRTVEDVAPPGQIKLLNRLPMDDYLYGVVPRESPSYFHPEALKAQALVARSYAYTGSSELNCNTWDQVYNGHSSGRAVPDPHEAASTNSAVDATSGRYVTYDGNVIQTFFHSSSGGHTANIEDVWITSGEPSTLFPYRAGVLSQYEASAGDPNASWPAQNLTGLQIAQKLVLRYPGTFPSGAGVSVWVVGVTVDRAPSGFVRTMDIAWSNGQTTTDFKGTSFQYALSLKSSKFYVVGFPMERIEGQTRYETAVRVSENAFPSSAPVVIVASGEDFADALAGSALAGARNGSLLLSGRDSLPAATRDEIERLQPSAVYVLGGESALTEDVFSAIEDAAGFEPERIAGRDRYVTAALVAQEVRSYVPGTTALVASGSSWPDAAALSALAYARSYPILLAHEGGLPEETREFLQASDPTSVLVAGGTAVLSSAVNEQITAATGVTPVRFAGSDRFETATLIVDYCVSLGFDRDSVYVATGEVYADALTGGVIAGKNRNPMIMTRKDTCPTNTALWLSGNKSMISKFYILGGSSAVSDEGLFDLGAVMAQ